MQRSRLFLFLFSLPFTLLSLVALLFLVAPPLYDWSRMQEWVAVEATLLSADIDSHRSNKNVTHQATATYSYTYGMKRYQGNRVGLFSGSDNLGDWQERTHQAMTQARPFRVWVNPDNPAEAIFDREPRWGLLAFSMMFVVVFGRAGIGLAFKAWRGEDTPEGEPLWLANPAWRDNQIRSNARAGMWGMWLFAIFWLLLSSPIVFIVPDELAEGNYPAALGLLFPLVGLVLVATAISKTLQWRRFGATPLSLAPFPGVIGGEVGGIITITRQMPADAEAVVHLQCEHVYQQGSGKNSTTRRELLWEERQQVRCTPFLDEVRIGFRFQVPEGLPASSKYAAERYEWTLHMTCPLPGVDLDRSYIIPVFPESNREQSAVRVAV